MPTSASSQTSVAASSHSFSMPSAVENDQLVLIVAIGTGDDEHDTPADWTEEWVAGTDDIALYVYTRKAGVGGAGGTSVSTTTGSDLVASAIGFNFGQNTDVDTFAPDGSGNSSFDLKHQSFTGSIPTGVTFCSIACWEFARTLSVWPIDYPNNQEVEEQNNCNLAAALSAVRSTEPTRPDFTINNAAEWSGVGFYVKPSGTTPTAVNIDGIKIPVGVDEPTVGSINAVLLDGIRVATGTDEPTVSSENSVSLDGITAGTGSGELAVASENSVSLSGIAVGTGSEGLTVAPENSVSLDGITVATGVDDVGGDGSTSVSIDGITVATRTPSPAAAGSSSVSLDGIAVATGASSVTGGFINPSVAVSLDGIAVGTSVADDLGTATYTTPVGMMWCCCGECVCNLIGSIYGPDDGEPECQGKIDIVPNPCDSDFDYSKVKWQIIRVTDDPETIVLDGDYNDYVEARDNDSYLRFYMTSNSTYELRLWYEHDSGYGGLPPCDDLPSDVSKYTDSIDNAVSCCPNSCPIDPTAISSNVTLSGYSSYVQYDVAHRLGSGGVIVADFTDPVGYWKRTRFIDWDILNGTFSTLEVKQAIVTGDYDCIRSLAEHKIIYLGEVEMQHQEFYNAPFVPPGPTTQAHAKGKVWLSFGNADITGAEPVLPASPDLHNLGTNLCRLYLKTTEYQNGQSWNLDNSPRTHGVVSWPGSSIVGEITRHYLRPDDPVTLNPDDLLRPCFTNYGPTYDHSTMGYPDNAPVRNDDPTYHPDWYNYDRTIGTGEVQDPWPCRSVWVVN